MPVYCSDMADFSLTLTWVAHISNQEFQASSCHNITFQLPFFHCFPPPIVPIVPILPCCSQPPPVTCSMVVRSQSALATKKVIMHTHNHPRYINLTSVVLSASSSMSVVQLSTIYPQQMLCWITWESYPLLQPQILMMGPSHYHHVPQCFC